VGAARPDSEQPTVAHYDGQAWETHDVDAASGDALWVHVFSERAILVAGGEGMVLSWQEGEWRRVAGPDTRAAVWGVWGASPADVWAVGGDVLSTGAGF